MPRPTPAPLAAHKKARRQSTCFCWAIKPKNGPWEGYTSFGRALQLPEYLPVEGDEAAPPSATVPAMRYSHRAGVSPTAIPTRLNLSQQAAEVMVLAFDPVLLDNGYYEGASFEAFEINWRGDLSQRDVLISGEIGRAEVQGASAKIRLTPWHAKTNEPIGRTCGALCDVGRVREIEGEEFGTERCAGEYSATGGPVPADGPKKADWTTAATVMNVTDAARFRLRFETQTQSGKEIYFAFASRLIAGKVETSNQAREIKAAASTGHQSSGVFDEVDIELSLPLQEAPTVGAVVSLVGGCRRTADDCKFFGNFSGANPDNPRGGEGYNFQGYYKVPGKKGAQRRAS